MLRRTAPKRTAKKAAKYKAAASKTPPKLAFFDHGDVPDNISRFLDARNLVPERLRGTDLFLDILSWNIRWFDHQDSRRVTAIADVLEALNADVFVLVEIAQDGALDEVVAELARRKAGFYSVAYGTTGDQQRVALVWDRDWLRSKRRPVELFKDEAATVIGEDGLRKDVFPRLPLWGWFEAVTPPEAADPPRRSVEEGDPPKVGFTFELVGVHLKSQMPPKGHSGRGGVAQRSEAAERLAAWLTKKDEHYDADILVIGDFNAAPDAAEWAALDALERQGGIDFRSINPSDRVTHVARLNKAGPGGTALDMHLITKTEDIEKLAKDKAVVIQWSFFDHLADLTADERKLLHKAMRMNFSDHLPVASRFYFTAG